MANMEHYLPFLLKWEGGYTDDPSDHGGATNRGVTLTTYRRLHPLATKDQLQRMTDDEWKYIVERFYWGRCEANAIRNQSVAEMLVDWTWLSGPQAIRFAQTLLHVVPDGQVGSITLQAINAINVPELFERLRIARLRHFQRIVQRHPSQGRFINGWRKRVNSMVFEA
jgi:lysozyme family protein